MNGKLRRIEGLRELKAIYNIATAIYAKATEGAVTDAMKIDINK